MVVARKRRPQTIQRTLDFCASGAYVVYGWFTVDKWTTPLELRNGLKMLRLILAVGGYCRQLSGSSGSTMGLDRWPDCGHKGAVSDEEDDRSDWGGGLHRTQHRGRAQSPRRRSSSVGR